MNNIEGISGTAGTGSNTAGQRNPWGVAGTVDVAIVGGGLAGLAAACYLARAGRTVALFERSAALGGMASSQNHESFIFNRGAHALYAKSPSVQVLAELGVRFTAGSPKHIRGAQGGALHTFPDGPLALLGTTLLPPAAKWEATRLLMGLGKIKPGDLAAMTVAEWLDREVRHPAVHQLLEATMRVATYTDAPGLLSMAAAAEQLQLAAGRVLYVDGGWQSLVDGLARTAQQAGVRLYTAHKVARVGRVSDATQAATANPETDAGWEVWASGEGGRDRKYQARSVLLAVGPKEAAGMVAERDGGTVLRGWADRALPVKAAVLDVALRHLPRPQNAVVIGLDRPLFLTTQSSFARIAPPGSALVHTLKYLPPGETTDPAADEQELEAWLEEAQLGWRGALIRRQYLPHIVVSNALPTAAQGGPAGRIGAAVPGARGLFLAGDWVGARGVLSGASLSSAREAAQLILQRLPQPSEQPQPGRAAPEAA